MGGKFLNNIIISFDKEDEEKVKFDSLIIYENEEDIHRKSTGFLQFPSGYRSCWIIDGQT